METDSIYTCLLFEASCSCYYIQQVLSMIASSILRVWGLNIIYEPHEGMIIVISVIYCIFVVNITGQYRQERS